MSACLYYSIKNNIRKLLENYWINKGFLLSDFFYDCFSNVPEKLDGDIGINFAFKCAKVLKKNPKDIADDLIEKFSNEFKGMEKYEIINNGFINIVLKNNYIENQLNGFYSDILPEEDIKVDNKKGKILIEFVSANPTGPLHIGHGRGACIGDTLARILKKLNYSVTKEYYVNDTGNQIENLGRSIVKYIDKTLVNEIDEQNLYQGEYIKEIAEKIKDGIDDLKDFATIGRKTADIILEEIKTTLKNCRIGFDTFFYESILHKEDRIGEIFNILKEKKLIYKKDGALWLKTTKFNDDKDRVLKRQDGRTTYFAADIAYHKDKIDRKYDQLINIWGADHHGYIDRIKAGLSIFNYPEDSLKIILVQLVKLIKDKQIVQMSTRKATYITLDELIDEVGSDAARFIFLTRHYNSPLDFDIDLAKKMSNENPVFYVQYAYARICSIFRNAEKQGIKIDDVHKTSFKITETIEKELMLKILEYPYVLGNIARSFSINQLPEYLIRLSEIFHKFYNLCPVLQDEKNILYRLKLLFLLKKIIKDGLSVCAVHAPEQM